VRENPIFWRYGTDFLSSRYDDRLWIRSSSIRATSALLDVHWDLPECSRCEPRWLTSFSSFGENHLRAVWRMSLGLGVIPALVVFLWRMNMDEPERFKKDSMRDTRIPYLLVIKRYWVSLLAISFTWCVLWGKSESLGAPAEMPVQVPVRFHCVSAHVVEKPLEFSSSDWEQSYPVRSNFLCIKSTSYRVAWTVRNLFFYHHRSVNFPSVSSRVCSFIMPCL